MNWIHDNASYNFLSSVLYIFYTSNTQLFATVSKIVFSFLRHDTLLNASQDYVLLNIVSFGYSYLIGPVSLPTVVRLFLIVSSIR